MDDVADEGLAFGGRKRRGRPGSELGTKLERPAQVSDAALPALRSV